MPLRRKPTPEVEWHIPVDLGFLRTVPTCNVRAFVLRDNFLYPLFTYGDFRPLGGGSFENARTRRLTTTRSATFCLREGLRRSVACSRPHEGTIAVRWTIVFSR